MSERLAVLKSCMNRQEEGERPRDKKNTDEGEKNHGFDEHKHLYRPELDEIGCQNIRHCSKMLALLYIYPSK